MCITVMGKQREHTEFYGSVSNMMSDAPPRHRWLFKAFVYSSCCIVGLVVVFFALMPVWAQRVVPAWTMLAVAVGALYIGLEVIFALWVYCIILPDINNIAVPPKSHVPCREHFRHTMLVAQNLPKHVYTIEKLIRGYFRQANISDIQMDNYHSFFAYALFAKHFSDLTSDEKEEVVDMSTEVVRELLHEIKDEHFRVRPGFNPEVHHVAVTLEPVYYVHKILLIYAFKFFVWDVPEPIHLRFLGFTYYCKHGVRYWYRAGTSPDTKERRKATILFHGIAVGWTLYFTFLSKLSRDHDVILVNSPHVMVMSLDVAELRPDDFANAVQQIMNDNGNDQVTLIGHSFGTNVTSWCMRRFGDRVSRLILLDPASILQSFPDICYNVFYRTPFNALSWGLKYGMVSELTIAYTMYRQFWWYESIFWLEDVSDGLEVFVGCASDDIVLNPIAVNEYVKMVNKPLHQSVVWDGLQHNDCFSSEEALRDIISFINHGTSSSAAETPRHMANTI